MSSKEERERALPSSLLLRIAGLLTDYQRSVQQVERAQDDAAKRAGEIGQRSAHKEILDEIRALLRETESPAPTVPAEPIDDTLGDALRLVTFAAEDKLASKIAFFYPDTAPGVDNLRKAIQRVRDWMRASSDREVASTVPTETEARTRWVLEVINEAGENVTAEWATRLSDFAASREGDVTVQLSQIEPTLPAEPIGYATKSERGWVIDGILIGAGLKDGSPLYLRAALAAPVPVGDEPDLAGVGYGGPITEDDVREALGKIRFDAIDAKQEGPLWLAVFVGTLNQRLRSRAALAAPDQREPSPCLICGEYLCDHQRAGEEGK